MTVLQKQKCEILIATLIFFVLLPSSLSNTPSHHGYDFPSFPDLLFATKLETIESIKHLDVYFQPCNITMYQETAYKKAWDLADKNMFSEGAKNLNHYISVTRKGRTPEWRRAVCDAWPYSLFECKTHKEKKADVCQCLTTSLTTFKAEKHIIPGAKDTEMMVCRVLDGSHCSSKSTPLRCADSHECISQICGASKLNGLMLAVPFVVIFVELASYFKGICH